MTSVLFGLMIPLQAILKAKLCPRLGHPLSAALFDFTLAICCIVFFMIALRLPPPHFFNFSKTYIDLLCGSLVGSIYIFNSLILLPRQ